MPDRLALLLGGGMAGGSEIPSRPDPAAEQRRERRRALARNLRRVLRDEAVDDDELVTAIEDSLAGFQGD